MKIIPATLDDTDFLLYLKNDPVMRSFAVVTHDEIKKEDHEAWLKVHLSEIKIIIDERQRIGMFRISEDKEASINIAPEYRGKGYGTKVLGRLSDKVWAKIVATNIASLNLFVKNGFKIVNFKDGIYRLEN